MTADIRNCRLQFIDPRTSRILRAWRSPGRCKHDPPRAFAYPNGATPLDNGDPLVTQMTDAWITRLTREGKVVWQYGVTDTPGQAPGFLFYPDGMDLDVFRDWKATLSAS